VRKILLVLLALAIAAAGAASARAQSAARLELYDLHTEDFPSLRVSLDVFDSSGSFVTGLTPERITLLEDEQPQQLTGLQEAQPGTQFVLAFDAGPAFAFRDIYAVTRFEKVVNALKTWSAPAGVSPDDMSLVATGADPRTHLDGAAFLQALEAYQPNLQTVNSSLETLARALTISAEPAPQPGMKRVLLYITSVPRADTIPQLQELARQAVNQNVRLHVWIVDSTDYFAQSGATALKDMALATGGQTVLFSGEEPLPGLETYLAPLRHMYILNYESALRSGGGHTLRAQVELDGEAVSSPALSFEFALEAPNPILVAPPAQIVRQAPEEDTRDLAQFVPFEQAIEILVEFPDGRTRPLARTALLVDGILVGENTTAPFERFTWDLRGYTSSAPHTLSVEAADTLGLSRSSIGVPVMVTVVQPERGLLGLLARGRLWLVLGAIGLAGMVLAVSLGWGRIRHRRRQGDRSTDRDPVTQPVQVAAAQGERRATRSRSTRKTPDACLLRLKENGEPVTAPPIPVTVPEMTFGSDPLHATRILDDPSVSPLHARLVEKDGEFVLTDENSAAGTWVNYEPLQAARVLKHGDVLHIGRVSYRFMRLNPPEPGPVHVVSLKK
jgi:hypothetical protein